jgi:hypothetical protein
LPMKKETKHLPMKKIPGNEENPAFEEDSQ